MNADEVLDVIARYQESLNWLANDGRQHIADARLSVFRSEEHFAVFTELPHFAYRANRFDDWLGCAGDCLVFGAYDTQCRTPRAELIEEVPEAPLYGTSYRTQWLADRSAFSVRVRGQRFDFAPSPEDYERAGIVFDDGPGIVFEEQQQGPNTINPGQLLRFVSVALDHPFFLSEMDLRRLIQLPIEPEMSLFLQTDRWQHPMYLVSSDAPMLRDSYVENIPCWKILSRAVASGDLSEWNSQDTSSFNTDWASLERIYHQHNMGYGFD